jgi:hypothetical protein
MPEEYRPPAIPTKHPNTANQVRDSWIVVGPAAMSPEQVPRPSLDDGSIRLVNPLLHPAPSPDDYRPPPPLIAPGSRTSSAASIPYGAGPPTITPSNPNHKLASDLTHNVPRPARDRPFEPTTIQIPTTPREAIGHLDASQLHAKEDRDSVVQRKRNRASGMLGGMFGSHEPRSSMEEIESIHSNHVPEKV